MCLPTLPDGKNWLDALGAFSTFGAVVISSWFVHRQTRLLTAQTELMRLQLDPDLFGDAQGALSNYLRDFEQYGERASQKSRCIGLLEALVIRGLTPDFLEVAAEAVATAQDAPPIRRALYLKAVREITRRAFRRRAK